MDIEKIVKVAQILSELPFKACAEFSNDNDDVGITALDTYQDAELATAYEQADEDELILRKELRKRKLEVIESESRMVQENDPGWWVVC